MSPIIIIELFQELVRTGEFLTHTEKRPFAGPRSLYMGGGCKKRSTRGWGDAAVFERFFRTSSTASNVVTGAVSVVARFFGVFDKSYRRQAAIRDVNIESRPDFT